jgi:hypothetical protein
VRKEHALDTLDWWIAKAALNVRNPPQFDERHLADDSWLPSLERLWERMRDETDGSNAPAYKRQKRSTNNGDARRKIIASITLHHQYDNGSCLTTEPAQVNVLARQCRVSASTVSDFFKSQFGGHAKYRNLCMEATLIGRALMILNGEVTPKALYRNVGLAADEVADE